jgi:hypothetical protein
MKKIQIIYRVRRDRDFGGIGIGIARIVTSDCGIGIGIARDCDLRDRIGISEISGIPRDFIKIENFI